MLSLSRGTRGAGTPADAAALSVKQPSPAARATRRNATAPGQTQQRSQLEETRRMIEKHRRRSTVSLPLNAAAPEGSSGIAAASVGGASRPPSGRGADARDEDQASRRERRDFRCVPGTRKPGSGGASPAQRTATSENSPMSTVTRRALTTWLIDHGWNVTDEKANATTNRAIVMARRTRGVSQVMCWACSHDRAPLAPAAAAITHPAHMGG